MAGPLEQSFRLSRRGHGKRGHTEKDTLAAHKVILDAIRSGNPKAAAAAMRAHLEDTERDIRSVVNSIPDRPMR